MEHAFLQEEMRRKMDEIVATQLESIREQLKEQSQELKRMSEFVEKLARIDERQSSMQSTFAADIKRCEEQIANIYGRLAALEATSNKSGYISGNVAQFFWIIVAAGIAYFFGHK